MRHANRYSSLTDNDNDLSRIETADLELVYNDLVKRKYQFQFQRTPVDHILFVNKLRDELKTRKETPKQDRDKS